MKKTAIALALASTLGSPVYGDGIYVGDVKFRATEICSKEGATNWNPNSGCLPLARVSNIQNYFFERMRLPISHDEANKVDAAAAGFLAESTALVRAADAATVMAETIKSVDLVAVGESKLLEKRKAAVDAAKKAAEDVKDADAAAHVAAIDKAVLDKITKVNAIVTLLTDGIGKNGSKFKLTGDNDSLSKALDEVNALRDNIQTAIDEVSKRDDVSVKGSERLAGLNKAIAALMDGEEILNASARLGTLDAELTAKLKDFDGENSLSHAIELIKEDATRIGEKNKVAGEKLTALAQALQSDLAEIELHIAPLSHLNSYGKHLKSLLDSTKDEILRDAKIIHADLSGIKLNTTSASLSSTQLRYAATAAKQLLLDDTSESAIHANLLPSLIGRVFVTHKDSSGSPLSDLEQLLGKPEPENRFKVPRHGGNFQLIPLNGIGKIAVRGLKTEVLVNTDLSGVIRKTLGANGTVDVNKLVTQAVGAVGLASPLKSQLTAQLSTALSQTSLATGSYYFVSMIADELDELAGNKLDGCISFQPAERDEARQTSLPLEQEKKRLENADAQAGASKTNCTSPLTELNANLAKMPRLDKDEGLGIITGVAILRTRSGKTEACSTTEVGVRKTGNKAESIGNDATTCDDLRNILAGNGVPKASIPGALAALNAGYRRESYKILKIGDHASVLALQWIPLSVTGPLPGAPGVKAEAMNGRKIAIDITPPAVGDNDPPIVQYQATATREDDLAESLPIKTSEPNTKMELGGCAAGKKYSVAVVTINKNGPSADGVAVGGLVTCK